MREAMIVSPARTSIGKTFGVALDNPHGATMEDHVFAAPVARAGLFEVAWGR